MKVRIHSESAPISRATHNPVPRQGATDEQVIQKSSFARQIQRARPVTTHIEPTDLLSLQQSIGNQAVMRLISTRSATSQNNPPQNVSNARMPSGGKAGGKGADDFLTRLAIEQQGSTAAVEDQAPDVQTMSLQHFMTGGKSGAQNDIDAFSQRHSAAQIASIQRQLMGGHSGTDQTGVLRRKGSKASAKTAPTTGTPITSTVAPTTAANTLTKTTVAGPTALNSGGFSWTVQWKLGKPSMAGGWIIQGVNMLGGVTGTAGKVATGWESHVPYWEAWQVNPGQAVTNFAEAGDPTDDTYANPGYTADTKGTLTEAGNAVFYEGQALPTSFAVRPGHPAGILPVATSAPALAGGTSPLVHNLTATWDPASGSPATTVTTV